MSKSVSAVSRSVSLSMARHSGAVTILRQNYRSIVGVVGDVLEAIEQQPQC